MLKKYLITSPGFYTSNLEEFRKILSNQIEKELPDYVLYRDKTNPKYREWAKVFTEVCNEFENVKAFLHGEYELADTFEGVGVHLTSLQFDKIIDAKRLGLEVVVSTHTLAEVQRAESLGADYVTYSPIFFTPNKGEPKGIENLEAVISKTTIKVFALGGIVNEKQVRRVSKTSAYGFASIRYFQHR